MDLIFLPVIIFVGILIGITTVTVGGGALINVPFLMAIGLGPLAAIATNKLSVAGAFVTGGYHYHSKGKLPHPKIAAWLSLAAFLGSFIGANLVLKMNEVFLKKIIIWLLLVVLVVINLKHSFGLHPKKHTISNVDAIDLEETAVLGHPSRLRFSYR